MSFNDDGKVIDKTIYYNNATASLLQPDGKIVIIGDGASDKAAQESIIMRFLGDDMNVMSSNTSQKGYESLDEKLIIPNLLRKNQTWQITGLPAENKIVLTDQLGRTIVSTNNYRNNQSFSGFGQGVYFYSIFIKQPDGKTQVYKGKMLLME